MAGQRIRVKFEGSEEVLRALKAAHGNARKALRAAVKAGAEVWRKDAERRAPQARYKKRIISKVMQRTDGSVEANVQLAKKVWYLRYSETGATAHEIKASGAGMLVFKVRGRVVAVRRVRHPGLPAKPFMRPAFDTQQGAVLKVFGETMRAAVVDARIAQAARDEGDD